MSEVAYSEPTRRLWTQVLAQALIDAIPAHVSRQGLSRDSLRSEPYNLHKLDEARAWLRMNNPDFHKVCHLAGREPDEVLRHYRRQAVPREQLVRGKKGRQ